MENAEQSTSVPAIFTSADSVDYVTVVSVGSNEPAGVPKLEISPKPREVTGDYVTVLKIGNEEDNSNVVTEETFVYRLPGEKLGFGLKFEGGTKPEEFVKRLFIQSCAVNSPASRVQSSWGSLTEGDEVLEIDSVPVNSMTRIDCVRCLKNSNVVIKLLIRHRFDDRTRIPEDLPLVVSAEKKRTPPPPPPVPPRKVNRKSKDSTAIFIPPKGFDDGSGPKCNEVNSHNTNTKNHAVQSPYINSRKSPEVSKNVRRRDIVIPPDAEVYTDLFLQESAYSLSESDDTGSSISTVVDRLGSFPTTTNSSFAGSLPSTPTPVQRHIDLTDDIDFSSKLVTSQAREDDVDALETSMRDQKTDEISAPLQPPASFQDAPLSYGNEHVPVVKPGSECSNIEHRKKPPPRNKNQIFIHLEPQHRSHVDSESTPVTPTDCLNLPRLVDFVPKHSRRLPLNSEVSPSAIEIVAQFIENEKRLSDLLFEVSENQVNMLDFRTSISLPDTEPWNDESEPNSFTWNLPSKLATIGEDEEDVQTENLYERKPSIHVKPAITTNQNISSKEAVPIIKHGRYATGEENGEHDVNKGIADRLSSGKLSKLSTNPHQFDVDIIMDSPPIYSRQPPDGHEFPDYQEVLSNPQQISEEPPPVKHRAIDGHLPKNQTDKNSVRDKIAIFSNSPPTLTKKYTSSENVSLNQAPDTFSDSFGKSKTISKSSTSLDNLNGFSERRASIADYSNEKTQSSLDLSSRNSLCLESHKEPLPRLHVRSQSLTNVTLGDFSQKHDRWSLLIEQRRKGYSKLKDLVIPEHIPENDVTIRPVIDLPEIKSNIFPFITPGNQKAANSDSRQALPVHVRNQSTSCLTSPPWSSKTTDTLPKYSPAFKRKSLKIYGAALPAENKEIVPTAVDSFPNYNHVSDEVNKYKVNQVSKLDMHLSAQNDAPKSLESITSPTRSDCSFEYVSSPEIKATNVPTIADNYQISVITNKPISHIESESVPRSEDESDSDSALSSSQSSYMSKNSSSASPVQLQIEYTSHALYNATDSQANERLQKKGFQSSCQLEIGNYDSLSRRLLKPQSVEAINRKNILASAKCRSGRDLKGGSPLIQRKFEEEAENPQSETVLICAVNHQPETIVPKEREQKTYKDNDLELVKVDAPEEEVLVRKSSLGESGDACEVVEKKDTHKKSTERAPAHDNSVTVTVQDNNVTVKRTSIVGISKPLGRAAAPSVTDLRRNFEKAAPTPAQRSISSPAAPVRVVSTEEIRPSKRSSLPILAKSDPVKCGVSEQLTERIVNDILNEYGESISKEDLKAIILKPEVLGASLGITLAGGADYETKEITVHKIRNGSPAFKDGRLLKGDRILSINGTYMRGLSHGQSIAALKEIVPEVVIVACAVKDTNVSSTLSPKTNSSFHFQSPATVEKNSNDELSKKGEHSNDELPNKGETFEVVIEKDAAGLGFSIQGGKGSVHGDVPLVIKKLFMGGPAERSGKLAAGDELLEINRTNVASLSRMDAWNLMKKLPEGNTVLLIHR